MISQNLIDLIKKSEGFSSKPYRDSVGVWTIAFGFTHLPSGEPVTEHTPEMGEAYAAGLLQQLLQQFINGVNAMCPQCNQNQKDALTDFAYNLGLGSLQSSTLLKLVKANPDDPAIAGEFRRWIHAGGDILQGLVTRRENEISLYFTPIIPA